jgi:hypothetical protein
MNSNPIVTILTLLFFVWNAYNTSKEVEEFQGKEVYVMKGEHAKVCAVTNSRLLGKLTVDAEFSCARCGSMAHNKASVCDPVALEPDH